MSEYGSAKTEGADNSCAFFGEGVTFKGSITAPERIVVHGTVEGDLVARDLLVGPTGTIKGNVKVDQADIQGKVLQNIEARVCLSLRKTGRIEGSAVYGDIEIEKGGVLAGEVSSIKGNEKDRRCEEARERRPRRLAGDRFRHHPLGCVILGAEARATGRSPRRSKRLSFRKRGRSAHKRGSPPLAFKFAPICCHAQAKSLGFFVGRGERRRVGPDALCRFIA